jgi:hypothetical protein
VGSTLGGESNEDNPAHVDKIEDSTQQRNKGGRPVGSRNANKIEHDITRKKAVNWVVTEYIELQEAAGKKVKKGTLTKLVHEAKTTFEIEGEFDETGSNTHGKDDGANGGEKKVTGKGQEASQEVGVNDDHHTVLPIHNLLGVRVMNCIIFKGQEGEVDAVWELGVDVFANEIGFGPGKRYPGGPTTVVNGKEIPCVFTASPSASKDSCNGHGKIR